MDPANMATTSYMFEGILLGAGLVAVLAWLSIRLATRVGLLDFPNSAPHKLHNIPMPVAGGLAMIGSMLISGLLFGVFGDPSVVALFWPGLLIFLFGLWDDFSGISPQWKIVGQIIAAVLLIRLGVAIQIFESPEFFLSSKSMLDVYADWFITILWVVGITNAFNFVDSMDGLALGLGGTAAAFFMLVTLDAGQVILSRYSALILGICIGLYLFNSSPAKLFLGDSGAQTLGFVLAVLAIAYTPKGANQSSSWFVPIMLLGVPIFDTALVVLSRLRRRKRVYTAALDHTYHRLIGFGWSSNRAVLAMQVAALALGCLAFVALTRKPLLANTIFALSVLAGILGIAILDSRKRWL
jgi:UDP-GlcNAc:undecaprenyl-phosphate GlcNAc-1-phosphate transferase